MNYTKVKQPALFNAETLAPPVDQSTISNVLNNCHYSTCGPILALYLMTNNWIKYEYTVVEMNIQWCKVTHSIIQH